MLPHFLIIGAQKSATTFLQMSLSLHPKIFIPKPEILFFEDSDYGDGDLGPLEAFYRDAPADARLGLKRPDYLSKPECPERIARHLPDAKLIVVLRNPVSRIVSAYYHYMRGRSIPCAELNDGMLRLLNGDYKDKHPRSQDILEFGLYAKHLRRYFEYFERENIFIINQEKLLSNKVKYFEEVCKFLNVDSKIVSQTQEKIVNKGVFSIPRIRLQRIAHSLIYTISSDGMRPRKISGPLANTKRGIGYVILAFGRLLSLFVSNKQPVLNAELRTRIQEFYRDDLADLELLLGTDFSNWNR